jgi:uncharacterized SAM-binding protein YcdF (DUF218 family)
VRTFFASAIRIALAALIAVSAYVGATYASIREVGKQVATAHADVIVVLGAAQYDGTPSPLLKSRLNHALSLYNAGLAPKIAVTGGKQSGDRFTEAAASRRWLKDHGVPVGNIISETTGHSTWESLHNLAPVLRTAGVQRVIVSSSAWHVQRCVLTLRELGFSVAASGAPSTVRDSAKVLKETIGVSIGRIIGFRRLFSITG